MFIDSYCYAINKVSSHEQEKRFFAWLKGELDAILVCKFGIFYIIASSKELILFRVILTVVNIDRWTRLLFSPSILASRMIIHMICRVRALAVCDVRKKYHKHQFYYINKNNYIVLGSNIPQFRNALIFDALFSSAFPYHF